MDPRELASHMKGFELVGNISNSFQVSGWSGSRGDH